MFDIGFWELVVIAIIALLVIGPERLPGFAHDVGLWFGKLKRYIHHARRELETEFNIHENRAFQKNLDDLDNLLKNAPDQANNPDTEHDQPVSNKFNAE
jgi:sec-independent protein translocase protein TatB